MHRRWVTCGTPTMPGILNPLLAACDGGYVPDEVSILFGVVELPKVTLFGVWNGKDGRHGQAEQIDVDCRSPNVEPRLERDAAILGRTDRSR